MDMDFKTPQAPLIEPEQPEPVDPFKPDEPVAPAKKVKPPKQHRKGGAGKKFLMFVLVLILLGATGYGVFYWQHQHVDRLITQRQALNTQISQQQDQINSLTKQNADLTKAATPPTTDELVLAAVKDYCQSAVDPKTKKSLVFVAGTTGPNAKAVTYSTDKTFAQVNGACVTDASLKDGGKAYIVKHSGSSWVVVTSGTATDPAMTTLYNIPTTFN